MTWLAAAVSGLLLGLAPPSPLGAALTLAAMVAAARAIEGRPLDDAGRGAIVGLLWFGVGFGWFPATWTRFAGSGIWLAHALLVGLQATVPALAFALAGAALRRGVPRPAAVGLAWAAAEGLSGALQPLPAGPALWLAGAPALLWPAAIGGRALISGLAAAVGASPPRAAAALLGGWLAIGAAWHALPEARGPSLRVGVVQPGTGAFDARRASTADARAAKLLGLLDALGPADLVVTPEGAWPFDPGEGGARRAALHRALGERPPLVLGATVGAGPSATNSLLALADGAIVDRYDKRDLVPLAEERVWGLGKTRYRRGEGPRALGVAGVRAGALVCYEDVLPASVREAAGGAALLLAPSNDAWLGAGAGQHLDAARLAAVESGRWVVRPTANGISAVIDARARLRWTAPRVDGDADPHAPGHGAVLRVPLATLPPIGAHLGAWSPLLAAALLLGWRP